MNPQEIKRSVHWLKAHRFGTKKIQENPAPLSLSALTLENRYKVLKEAGFEDIQINTLERFLKIMNREISTLKTNQIIPYVTNVADKLSSHFSDCF